MGMLEVLEYPVNEMVLESAFDKLMENIRRQQFIYVSSGKVVREWLHM